MQYIEELEKFVDIMLKIQTNRKEYFMKKSLLLLAIFCLFMLTACNNSNEDGVMTSTNSVVTSVSSSLNITTLNYSNVDYETNFENTTVFTDGDEIMITESGVYEFSGDYNISTIAVNVDKDTDKGIVYLILNGANINSEISTPINIMEAKNVVIILADGTENTVTQNAIVTEDAEFPSGAIYSKADTVITGLGTLSVTTLYQDGINVRDDLIVEGATIVVNSAQDGIVGKDLLQISDSTITINSGKDGLKSSNDEDEDKGNVLISSGVFNINSDGDAISSDNNMLIDGGEFTLISVGGFTGVTSSSSNSSRDKHKETQTTTAYEEDTPSTKAIKSANDIVINDGNFNISSCDDAIHSNRNVVINGGTFELISNDDGVHADVYLQINDGIINISDCYEGLEAGLSIEINDGVINIVSSDDSVNASESTGSIIMNGGTITINYYGSDSDGFDSNGDFIQTGGDIIINKTNVGSSTQGAFDVDGGFYQTGGTIIDANGNDISLSSFSSSNRDKKR